MFLTAIRNFAFRLIEPMIYKPHSNDLTTWRKHLAPEREMRIRKIELEKQIEAIKTPDDVDKAWEDISTFLLKYEHHKKIVQMGYEFDQLMKAKEFKVFGWMVD